MISNGKLTFDTPISTITKYGLCVDVKLDQVDKDKPIIYTYTYKINRTVFKKWLNENAYLCEGPLAFIAKGIQVVVAGGPKNWSKTAFSIDSGNNDGEKIYLKLFTKEAKFIIHRDLFSGEEWDIFMNTQSLDENEIDEDEAEQKEAKQAG